MATECKTRLPDLEHREKRYDRVDGVGQAFRCDQQGKEGPSSLFLFSASDTHRKWGDEAHPILQSYLDCVLAGFYQLWGEEGVDHFIETTDGWHAPVKQDRSAPIYPRAISLEPKVRSLIDARLKAHHVEFLS